MPLTSQLINWIMVVMSKTSVYYLMLRVMGQPVPASLYNPEYIRGICQHVVGHEPTHVELFNEFDYVNEFPDCLTLAAMEFHSLHMWPDLEVQVTTLVLS